MSKRFVLNLVKYLLALGLLTYVVWTNWDPNPGNPEKSQGLKYVWQVHFVEGKPVHFGFMALAGLLLTASLLISFVRWHLLVRAQDLPFALPNALRLGAVGFFFSTFLPGSIGGDIVKAVFLAKENSRRTVAVATVLIDRAIALWALIWFVLLLGACFWLGGMLTGDAERQSKSIVISAGVTVGITVLTWIFLGILPPHRAERFAGRLRRLPKVGGPASEFWRAIWMYRQRPKSVAIAMLMSWVGHVGFVLAFYLSARTLIDPEQMPSLTQHFLLVPIGMVIQAMPLFPGGAGIGELGYGGLYALFHFPQANGVLGSLVQRVVCWIVGLLGFVVYLRMRPALKPEPVETAALAVAEV